MVTQNVNLTQTTKKIPSIVHVVQGDSGRQVVAKVTDQTISGTASMSFERPDGAVYTSTATINTTDNTMSVNLTSDMLNIAGNAKITFKVTTSNKTVSTFTLVAVIEPSAGFGQTPSVASNKIYVYVNGSAVEIAKQADVTSLTSRVGTNETNIIAINNDLGDQNKWISEINSTCSNAKIYPLFYQGSIDSNGLDVDSGVDVPLRVRTDFIKKASDSIQVKNWTGTFRIVCYDNNKNYISKSDWYNTTYTVNVANATYIRILISSAAGNISPSSVRGHVDIEFTNTDEIIHESALVDFVKYDNVKSLIGVPILRYAKINKTYEVVGLYTNDNCIALGFSGITSEKNLYIKVDENVTVYRGHSYSQDKYITSQYSADSGDVRDVAEIQFSYGGYSIYKYTVPSGYTNIGLYFKKAEIDNNCEFSFDTIPYSWSNGDGISSIIDCWGDSLTQSVNSENKSYPQLLSEFISKTVNNFGDGGEVAVEIAGRQGGCPFYLYEDVTIPSSGSVTIQLKSTYNDYLINSTSQYFLKSNNSGLNPCCIGGIVGNITNVNDVIKFTRATSGDTVTVKSGEVVYPRWGINTTDHTQIIFAGQNNMNSISTNDDLIKVIRNMISYYNNDKYLVICPIQRTNVNDIIVMEKLFKKEFGNKCLCLREYLNHYGVQKAIEYGFITEASEQDTTDISNGIIPSSLRVDTVHLNYYGYYIMAKRIAELLEYNKLI